MTSALAAATLNKSVLLLNGALGSCKLTSKFCIEKYCTYTKLHQCHNNNPQLNFTQLPRINFPELWAHSWNLGKFASRKDNLLHSIPLVWLASNSYTSDGDMQVTKLNGLFEPFMTNINGLQI